MPRHQCFKMFMGLGPSMKIAFAVVSACCLTARVGAATSLSEITQLEFEVLEAGAQSQRAIDALDDERSQLAARYRTTLKQNANLKKYNAQLRRAVQSQTDEIDSLHRQISRLSALERDIVPLMADMLEAFIKLDMPFLLRERTERVGKLRELFASGNVANSEKYRRILEAYQVENDYGRMIETYQHTIPLANSASGQTVTFLNIGRIAYVYQTLDGKQSFHRSQQQRAWRALDKQYNAKITVGIRMASEQIPSNLLYVPLTAPKAAAKVNF